MKPIRLPLFIILCAVFTQPAFAGVKAYYCGPPIESLFNYGDNFFSAVEDFEQKDPGGASFDEANVKGKFWNLGDDIGEYDLGFAGLVTNFKALDYFHSIPQSFENKPNVWIRSGGVDFKDDPAFAFEDDIRGVVFMSNADVSMVWFCKDEKFNGDGYKEFFDIMRPIDLKYALDELEHGDFLEDTQNSLRMEQLQSEQTALKDSLDSIDLFKNAKNIGLAATATLAVRAIVLALTKNPAVASSFAPMPSLESAFKSCEAFTIDDLEKASSNIDLYKKLRRQPNFGSCVEEINSYKFKKYCGDTKKCT